MSRVLSLIGNLGQRLWWKYGKQMTSMTGNCKKQTIKGKNVQERQKRCSKIVGQHIFIFDPPFSAFRLCSGFCLPSSSFVWMCLSTQVAFMDYLKFAWSFNLQFKFVAFLYLCEGLLSNVPDVLFVFHRKRHVCTWSPSVAWHA